MPATLIYFPAKAKVFLPSLVAEVANIPYNWQQIEMASWPSLKPLTPFGQLPIMEFPEEGIRIAQSLAIAHVLAKLGNLLGTSDVDFAVSEQLCQTSEDMLLTLVKGYYGPNKQPDVDEFFSSKLPTYLAQLERLARNGKFTTELTMGELAIFSVINIFLDLDKDLLDGHKEVTAFYNKVASDPKIADFLAHRVGTVWYKKDWDSTITRNIPSLPALERISTPTPGHVTFIYFPARGRLLLPMLVAEYGNIPYVWKSYEFMGQEWLNLKPKTIFGQLPIMEDHENGIFISQSIAIARVLARRTNLLAVSNTEFAFSEQLIYYTEDLFGQFLKAFFSAQKEELVDQFYGETLPSMTSKLESIIVNCLNKTLGEFALFAAYNIFKSVESTCLDGFPAMLSWYNKFESNPKISDFLANRAGNVFFKRDWKHTKLTYFEGRGLAEVVRLAFAVGNVDYEQEFVKSKEQWLAMKPTLPYGQVPIVQIDGRKLVQSRAIVQYLARKFKLYGSTPFEAYEIDELYESVVDFSTGSPLSLLFRGSPDAQAQLETFKTTKLAKYFGIWENMITKRGGKHFVGNKLSIIDLVLLNVIDSWAAYVDNLLGPYPGLAAFQQSISSEPRIAKYLASPKRFPYPPPASYVEEVVSILYS